jgi:hypothetical protein
MRKRRQETGNIVKYLNMSNPDGASKLYSDDNRTTVLSMYFKIVKSGWCLKTNRTTVLSTMHFNVVKSGWCFKTNRTTIMDMH